MNKGRLEAIKCNKSSSWLGSKKLRDNIKIVIKNPSQCNLNKASSIFFNPNALLKELEHCVCGILLLQLLYFF